MKRSRSHYAFLSAFLFSLVLSGCFGGGGHHGGGGGGGGGGNVNGGTANIVAPATASGIVQAIFGGQLTFVSKVSGNNGAGVNWYVCPLNCASTSAAVLGGNSALGTITLNTADKAPATYTAPASFSAMGVQTPDINAVTILAQQPGTGTGAAGPFSAAILVFVVPTLNALPTSDFTGGFSFVFRMRAFTSAGLSMGIIGRFTFDGVGDSAHPNNPSTGITNGFEDVNITNSDGSSCAYIKVPFTGGYNLDTPSHGKMVLNITSPAPCATGANVPPATMTIYFTLAQDGSFGNLIETDATGTAGSGEFRFQAQNVPSFTTASFFSNSFVISIAGPAGTGASAVHKGVVGRLDLGANAAPCAAGLGSILNTSTADDQSGGATQTLTGCFALDDPNSGHGTFNISVNGSSPVVTFYASTFGDFYALETDANTAGSGRAIQNGNVRITGSGFSNTSIAGPNVLELLGLTPTGAANVGHASAAVGAITLAANGTATGEFDASDGGMILPGAPTTFSGATVTVDTLGRGTLSIPVTVSGQTTTYNFVFYLDAGSVAFLQEQPPNPTTAGNRGRSGLWIPQSPVPGSSYKAGATFILLTRADTSTSKFTTGAVTVTETSNVNGNIAGTTDTSLINTTPILGAQTSGTYTVTDTTNQRVTVAVAAPGNIGGSATVAFYADFAGQLVGISTDVANQDPQIIFLDQ